MKLLIIRAIDWLDDKVLSHRWWRLCHWVGNHPWWHEFTEETCPGHVWAVSDMAEELDLRHLYCAHCGAVQPSQS